MTKASFLPRTRSRLAELGYPEPLTRALLGLACALEPRKKSPRKQRRGRRSGGQSSGAAHGAPSQNQRARL